MQWQDGQPTGAALTFVGAANQRKGRADTFSKVRHVSGAPLCNEASAVQLKRARPVGCKPQCCCLLPQQHDRLMFGKATLAVSELVFACTHAVECMQLPVTFCARATSLPVGLALLSGKHGCPSLL